MASKYFINEPISFYKKNGDESITEQIKEIHKYYKNIIDYLPSNVYWLDENCRGLGCNFNVLKTLQLENMEEFIGMDFATMAKKAQWTEGQGEKFLEDSKEVIRTGIPKYNIEEPPIPDGKGDYVYFLTSRVPLFKGEEVIGIAGISVDITSQKRAEQDLVKKNIEVKNANEARKFFIANMSHDMRTLVSGIVGISELLPSCKNDSKQTDEFHEILHDTSAKLLNMVNEILDLSWQSKVRIHFKKENITRLFYDIANFFQTSFKEKNLPLIVNISSKIPEIVICDSTAIHRIVSNLLGNALKYTHEGHVKFNVQPILRDNKKWIEILIEDTGIGIPEDKVKIIFDPFSRLHQTDISVYDGLGIGLSVVKTLVESLNGFVEVISELNKGSKFICLLPMIED
ncbi:MAG: PAS domain-containing sensor histidine kinase [Gammaproteobacteria bacterium]